MTLMVILEFFNRLISINPENAVKKNKKQQDTDNPKNGS